MEQYCGPITTKDVEVGDQGGTERRVRSIQYGLRTFCQDEAHVIIGDRVPPVWLIYGDCSILFIV